MTAMLLFVPCSPHQWRQTLSSPPVEGYAATASLREALGCGAGQDEDAEHAAMVLASVVGLSRHGTRFVLACELAAESVDQDPSHPDAVNGRVLTGAIDAGRVVSWFTDDAGVDTRGAATAASGASLDEAWELPAVASLLADHALLWHAAEELHALPYGEQEGA